MVLWWCRPKPSNLRCFSHQIRRSYFQVSGSRSVNYALISALIRAPSKPDLFLPKGPAEFACSSRFFGVRSKKKPKIKEERTVRTNDEITAEVVRIIVHEGDFIENTVVSTSEALERARKLNLDLVEVQPSGEPPVCRFMDFRKEKYKKQVLERERAKSKSMQPTLRVGEFKNVRLSDKIDKNDLKNKANTAKKLMEHGYRVKCTVLRSKLTREEEKEEEEVKKVIEERKIKDIKKLLAQFVEMISDVSYVEGECSVEKAQACIIIRHKMFGPAKKSGKKDTVSPPNMSTSSSTRSKLKMKDEISSGEGTTENRNAWAFSDANDGFDQLFDFDNGHEAPSSCDQEKGGAAKAPLPSIMNGVSDVLQPRPVIDSRQARTPPSDVIENRYKRSEPNKQPTGVSDVLQPRPVTDSRQARTPSYKRSEPNKQPTGVSDVLQPKPVIDSRQARTPPADVIENRYKRCEPSKQPTGVSDVLQPRPVIDSRQARTPPSDVIENRYKRSEPNKQPTGVSDVLQPRPVIDSRQARTPPSDVIENRYKRSEPSKQPTGTDSAMFRQPRTPIGTLSQSPPRPSHPGKQAPNEIPRHSLQPPSHHPIHHSSPVPSYGIFSAKKPDAAGRQDMAAEGNESQGGCSIDISKTPKSDDGQRSGTNKGGTGRWGIFSGDGATATSNRTSR